MALTPIIGICEVSKVSTSKADLPTPLALDRTSRTDDDSYGEAGEEADRGMEEDAGADAEPDESGPVEVVSSTSDPDKAVDFFA